MVPSGIAPQLTAINCPCFLFDKECIILEKDSLPEPLSPVINTVISVGATCSAIDMA